MVTGARATYAMSSASVLCELGRSCLFVALSLGLAAGVGRAVQTQSVDITLVKPSILHIRNNVVTQPQNIYINRKYGKIFRSGVDFSFLINARMF